MKTEISKITINQNNSAQDISKSSFWLHFGIIFSYGLLALAFTWPLATQFNSNLPGQNLDTWQTLWNFDWLHDAILSFQNPYFTHRLFAPEGTTLLYHTLAPANWLMGLPAQLLFGNFAAYNSVVFLSFALSGYAVWLFVRYLTANNNPAAYLAGFIFAFAPYRTAQLLGHLNLVSTQWLVFYIYFLWRILDETSASGKLLVFGRRHWRLWLAATFFLMLNIFTDWYYVFFLLIFTALLLLWRLLTQRRNWRQILTATFLAGSGGLLFGLPLIEAMLQRARSAPALAFSSDLSLSYSADLLAYFIPSVLHPLWGNYRQYIPAFLSGNPTERMVYPGYVTLFLIAVLLFKTLKSHSNNSELSIKEKSEIGSRKSETNSQLLPDNRQPITDNPSPSNNQQLTTNNSAFWFLAMLIFMILSLGPKLQIGGPLEPGIPLPFALLESTPLAGIVRVPSRFAVLAMLSAAILAGLGFHALRQISSIKEKSEVGSIKSELSFKYKVSSIKESETRNQKLEAKNFFTNNQQPTTDNPASNSKLKIQNSKLFLLLLLVGFEFWTAPYSMANNFVPTAYQEIAADQAAGTIIELPLQRDLWDYPRRMYYQTIHHKNILQGYTSREEANPLPPRNLPGVRQLLFSDLKPDITYDDSRTAAQTFFDFYKMNYVVIDDKQAGAKTLQNTPRMLEQLFGLIEERKWPKENFTLYKINPGDTAKSLTAPLLVPGANWFEPEQNQAGQYRWLGQSGKLLALVPANSGGIKLRIQGQAFNRPRKLVLQNDKGQQIAHLTVNLEQTEYESEFFRLPPGENWLNLVSLDGTDSPGSLDARSKDNRNLSVLIYKLRLL